MTHTRADYLDGKCSHKDYCLAIALELNLTCDKNLLIRVRESVDRHLNDIPLPTWDAAGAFISQRRDVHDAFKARGDFVTRAGMVSLLKVLYLEEATKP